MALFQIAPMLDISYRDFRYFMRLLTRRAQLWTEMVVENTVIHTDRLDDFLSFNHCEHPIVCQVGGSHPDQLRAALEKIAPYGYDEINLNCGCPSDRVCGKGKFGAVLMLEPERVRDCVREMKNAVKVPVTVKTRIGVDKDDSEEFTAKFIDTVAEAGCEHFIIHARKAWLKGLSPAQNRSVPPLDYSRVFRLCHRFPHLKFSLNGGIKTIDEVKRLLFSPETPSNLVGIMAGRVAYENPCALWNVDTEIYGEASNPSSSRRQILTDYTAYLRRSYPPTCACHGDGRLEPPPIHLSLKPILGIFANKNGNRLFRRTLDLRGRDPKLRYCGPAHILESVLEELDSAILDEPLDCEESPSKKLRLDTDALITAALQASRDFMLPATRTGDESLHTNAIVAIVAGESLATNAVAERAVGESLVTDAMAERAGESLVTDTKAERRVDESLVTDAKEEKRDEAAKTTPSDIRDPEEGSVLSV